MSARDRLLDAGEDRLLRAGFAATGVQGLLDEAGAPKGSFYHHFSSKEAFAQQVLERWFERQGELLETHLVNGSLERYFGALRDEIEASEWQRGCLIGTLGQELGAGDGELREAATKAMAAWHEALAAHVRDEVAGALIDAWEGAVLRSKLERGDAPLRAFFDITLPALTGSKGDT